MPNHGEFRDGTPRRDADRRSPDVERHASAGQSSGRAKGGDHEHAGKDRGDERPMAAGDSGDRHHGTQRKGGAHDEPGAQDYRGKPGLTSDRQPDLVSPSGVNQRRAAAKEKPTGGGSLRFDDDDMVHPRGKVTGAGRTWDEKKPSDAGGLGAPNVGMSDRNGPSDADAKRRR